MMILLGTAKGAFILSGERGRAFEVAGPFCGGWPINHVIAEPGTGHLFAGGGGDWEGAGVWQSRDHGQTWTLCKLANSATREAWIKDNPDDAKEFGMVASAPASFTGRVNAVWSLASGPDALYAGVKPAGLFKSTDGGESWALVEGLENDPSRAEWQPGGAGLTLHTILTDPDPDRLWVGISAAGVLASEDGGSTWERRVSISGSGAASIGMCVHNMMRAPWAGADDGVVIYQQNHEGVYRSTDAGRQWTDISDGLPSRFGFAIAAHPHDPHTCWEIPLSEMGGRFPPDAEATVWRSQDGGASWHAQRRGLPQTPCFFTVLRQAMAVDRETPAGVYFGTNSGSVFASFDEGDTWQEIATHLPTVLSVEVYAPMN